MKYIYIDVDSTLLFSAAEFPQYSELPAVFIRGRKFHVNTRLVESIKDFYARGHQVVIWSAGGADWACTAAQQAGIWMYIKHAWSKPDWLFDDKQPNEWLPPAEFINPLPDRNLNELPK